MKRHYPATSRNRGPILDTVRHIIPPFGVVLEVASGSGEHACWFSRHLPGVTWVASDSDPACLASIACWRRDEGLQDRMAAPVHLDVTVLPWPLSHADAVFCANMIHIAPWKAAQALFAGAAAILPAGAPLVLYGPFRRTGHPWAPSNAAFDADLRSRNPQWGIRDLDAVDTLAAAVGLDRAELVEMPANNLTVAWRKRP